MPTFTPSPEEVKAGEFSPETLFMAIHSFNRDGFLVMEGIEDPQLLTNMRQAMLPEREEISKLSHKAEEAKKTENHLHGPPAHKPELGFHKLYQNPFVLQVLNAYLGGRPKFIFTAGNNAGKGGTARQDVHSDCRVLHPEAPYMVTAQWVLSDFSSANGATEIWPGSHRNTSAEDHVHDPAMKMFIKQDKLDERSAIRPPIQVECKVGGVFLRDMRLWHAGMPNKSNEDRIMLACGYTPRWYHSGGKVRLPQGVEQYYPSSDLVEVKAEFVPMEEWLQQRHTIPDGQFDTELHLPDNMGRLA